MISSIGLTISGFVFTLLIAIIYFSKKKYHEIENKLYGFLLLWTIFLFLLEFYCVFTMRLRNLHPVLNEILCRLYILGIVVWFIVITMYIIAINGSKKSKTISDILKGPLINIYIIVCLGSYIVSCFLPLKYTSGIHNELYVIGGQGVLVLYVVSVIVGILLIYLLFRNKNKTTYLKKLPVFFFLVIYFLMFVIQYFYTDINDLTFMCGLAMVAMYFTIVSQDYKLVNDLEIAKEEAERANKEKMDFLSKMSHEIRTPMNAIMGFSESLLNDKEVNGEKIIDDTRNIYIAGNNLISTINNILDVTNIESGKEKLEESKYFIGDIIYDLQSFVEARIDNNRVNFIIDFDENIPCRLYGDKNKIHKVLLNILSNSARFTTDGEIKLQVSAKCEKGVAHLSFVISDTGIGIKEEDYDKIFAKFSKIDTGSLERGAGLGLNIAKSLLEMMNGNISFTSQFGVGTTFTIEFSNKIMDYHKCGDIISEKEAFLAKKKNNDFSGKRIMVVDDNKLNLKVADRFLRAYNFEVILVESGESCVTRIKQNEQYDLIIIDQLMPEMDGIDTIRSLKQLGKELPPIIATIANIDENLKNLLVSEGFDGYLSKPIDSNKLDEIINYYFKK